MRLIKYILPVAVLSLGSCAKDFLDVKPTDGLAEQDAATTKGASEALVNGVHSLVYNQYSGDQFIGCGQQNFNMYFDILGDDFINTRPAYHMSVYRWTDHRTVDGSINQYTWTYYYKIILNINSTLKTIAKEDASTPEAKRRLGEMHALRAWAYHNLVQLFGKRYVAGSENTQLGVVIRTEAEFTPKKRSTVGEVYALIDADLKKALENLKGLSTIGKNHINYAIASGIAARVALSKHNYAEAERHAEEAIANSGAKLQVGMDLIDGFNNWNASEWMWAYKQNEEQNQYFAGFGAIFAYNFSGRTSGLRFAVNRTLYDKTNASDVRRKWFVCKDLNDPIPADADGSYFTANATNPWEVSGQNVKYRSAGAKVSTMDLLYMRLGEMYYIQAEAEARQGKDAEAQATLYSIMKTRDEAYTQSSSTGEKLIEEVMDNKRMDLWGEGQRFFDMKRLGIVPNRLAAKNFEIIKAQLGDSFEKTGITRNSGQFAKDIAKSADDPNWEFMIPKKELEAAPNIVVQNP